MTHLEELFDFETKSVQRISALDFRFTIDYVIPNGLPLNLKEISTVTMILSIGSIQIHARMDQVFIHQVGKRIYGEEYGNDYLPLLKRWCNDFNQNNLIFRQKIQEAIISNGLIAKYYPRGDKNILYGFISNKFEDTDQLEFRKYFIEYATKTNTIKPNSGTQHKVTNRSNPTVKEYYDFNTSSDLVSLSCGIVYGINNGYGAYSTHWIRKLQGSGIWLSPWKSSTEFKWRNNPRFHDESAMAEMESFVQFIADEGTSHRMYVEEKIKTANDISLKEAAIKNFYELFRVAKATEDRIDATLRTKVIEKGNTLMSFVESICHVGTFDKYTSKAVKRLLIETGSRLLEDEGFDIILKDNKEIVLSGNYEWY